MTLSSLIGNRDTEKTFFLSLTRVSFRAFEYLCCARLRPITRRKYIRIISLNKKAKMSSAKNEKSPRYISDILQDPETVIVNIAKFLGYTTSRREVEDIKEKIKFSNMKQVTSSCEVEVNDVPFFLSLPPKLKI